MASHQGVDQVEQALEFVKVQELLDRSLNLDKQPERCDQDDEEDDSTLAIALTILERADNIENKLLAGENVIGTDAILLKWSSVGASYKRGRNRRDVPSSGEGDASGDDWSRSSSSTSIIDPEALVPIPAGVKVPEDPRKEFEAALSNIDWGYYKKGITSITSLAEIGFVPAKSYLNPSTTPLKNPSAALQIALHVSSTPNEPPNSALPWFRKAAEGGDAVAQLELAKRVFAADPGEAMVWLHRSWNGNGSAEAAFLIGCVFYKGFHAMSGGTGSPTAVREDGCENSALQNGDGVNGGGVGSVPWHLLDPDMAKGRSVSPDPVAAGLWFARAADRGHLGGHAAFGEIRLTGFDRQAPNPTLALRHIAKAAGTLKDDGNVKPTIPRAMYVLGQCLRRGVGTGKDEALASEWLKKAGELGFGADESAVAGNRRHGANHKKMSEAELLRAAKGVRMLRKAAVQGVPRAMYVLGLCLKKGFGTERDEEEGEEWMKKATECGFTPGSVDPIEPSSTLARTEDAVTATKLPTGAKATKPGLQKGKSELLAAAAAAAAQSMGGSTLGLLRSAVDPVEQLLEPSKSEEVTDLIVISPDAPAPETVATAEPPKLSDAPDHGGIIEGASTPLNANAAAAEVTKPAEVRDLLGISSAASPADIPAVDKKIFSDFSATAEDRLADPFAATPFETLYPFTDSSGEVIKVEIMAPTKPRPETRPN